MEPALRNPNQLSEDWMFPVFILLLIGIAYVRAGSPSRMKNIWRSSFNILWMRQTMREESNLPKEYVVLQICFFSLAGISLFCLVKMLHLTIYSLSGLPLFLLLSLAVALIYGLKVIGIKLTAFLVAGDFTLSEYLYNLFLINRLLSLFLFIPVILLCYSPLSFTAPLLIFIGLLVLIFYLYRLSRGLINALRSGIGAFYIFFYICTLEFLPLVLAAKFILSQQIA